MWLGLVEVEVDLGDRSGKTMDGGSGSGLGSGRWISVWVVVSVTDLWARGMRPGQLTDVDGRVVISRHGQVGHTWIGARDWLYKVVETWSSLFSSRGIVSLRSFMAKMILCFSTII